MSLAGKSAISGGGRSGNRLGHRQAIRGRQVGARNRDHRDGRRCDLFQVDEMVKPAVRDFGKIDILVKNAGGRGAVGVADIKEVSEDLSDKIAARSWTC